MLTKIKEIVKAKAGLAITIFLLALFFFFLGYICAKLQEKEPLRIIEGQINFLIKA